MYLNKLIEFTDKFQIKHAHLCRINGRNLLIFYKLLPLFIICFRLHDLIHFDHVFSSERLLITKNVNHLYLLPSLLISDSNIFETCLIIFLTLGTAIWALVKPSRPKIILLFILEGSIRRYLLNNYMGAYADNIFLNMLFWSCFLPMAPLQDKNSEFNDLSVLGLKINVFCIYFFTGINKYGEQWGNYFNAIEVVLLKYGDATIFANWLVSFPSILPFITASVLLSEIFMPFLLFLRGRIFLKIFCVFLFLFHLGISLSISLHFFLPSIALIISLLYPFRTESSSD